jgi:hypothetical protein
MAAVIGCGGSEEDKAMKEQISLMNEMSALLEKATNPEEAKKIEPEMNKLKKRAEDLETKVKGWSKEKQEAMIKKYKAELETAATRFTAAMMKAMFKGGPGGGFPEIKMPEGKVPEIKLPEVKLP